METYDFYSYHTKVTCGIIKTLTESNIKIRESKATSTQHSHTRVLKRALIPIVLPPILPHSSSVRRTIFTIVAQLLAKVAHVLWSFSVLYATIHNWHGRFSFLGFELPKDSLACC